MSAVAVSNAATNTVAVGAGVLYFNSACVVVELICKVFFKLGQ